MNISFSTQFPEVFDVLHAGLAGVAFVLLILVVVLAARKPKVITEIKNVVEERAAPEVEAKPAVASIKTATPDSALQLLSLLQQDARFVDFLQEDLAGFSDADIGAAARVVHEGGQKALANYFTLEPLRMESEESSVTVPAGFNPQEIRLTGNVVGDAPFNGVLVHKGWKVTEVKLPKLVEGHDVNVIQPAEVEL